MCIYIYIYIYIHTSLSLYIYIYIYIYICISIIPSSRIPAARLSFVFLRFFSVLSSTRGILKSALGMSLSVPNRSPNPFVLPVNREASVNSASREAHPLCKTSKSHRIVIILNKSKLHLLHVSTYYVHTTEFIHCNIYIYIYICMYVYIYIYIHSRFMKSDFWWLGSLCVAPKPHASYTHVVYHCSLQLHVLRGRATGASHCLQNMRLRPSRVIEQCEIYAPTQVVSVGKFQGSTRADPYFEGVKFPRMSRPRDHYRCL